MPDVACTIVGEFGPNLVVLVEGRDNAEEVPAHPASLGDPGARGSGASNRLAVGVVAADGEALLVEFPQEAMSGAWRLWVPSTSVRPVTGRRPVGGAS